MEHTGDTEWAKVRFHPQAQEDHFQDLAHNTAFHMCAFYAQSTNQPLELLDFFLGPLYAGHLGCPRHAQGPVREAPQLCSPPFLRASSGLC